MDPLKRLAEMFGLTPAEAEELRSKIASVDPIHGMQKVIGGDDSEPFWAGLRRLSTEGPRLPEFLAPRDMQGVSQAGVSKKGVYAPPAIKSGPVGSAPPRMPWETPGAQQVNAAADAIAKDALLEKGAQEMTSAEVRSMSDFYSRRGGQDFWRLNARGLDAYGQAAEDATKGPFAWRPRPGSIKAYDTAVADSLAYDSGAASRLNQKTTGVAPPDLSMWEQLKKKYGL